MGSPPALADTAALAVDDATEQRPGIVDATRQQVPGTDALGQGAWGVVSQV